MDFEDIPEAADDNAVLTNTFSLPEPEPEDALAVFNREWNKKLDAKRQAEFEAEQAARTKAADDRGNWNQQREVRLNAKMDKNRSEEQVLLETLESEADAGSTWDRVTKMIDATAEGSESSKSDVVRMRKLFIQLKNEPLDKTRGGIVA